MAHPVVWFEVRGKDISALQRFYRGLFDWQIVTDGSGKYHEVTTGDTRGIPGGFGELPPTVPAGTQPWVTFYVESPDIRATLDKAVALGGKVFMPRREVDPGTVIGLFQDPEGHIIGLIEHRPAGA